jgi:hypothetical protein
MFPFPAAYCIMRCFRNMHDRLMVPRGAASVRTARSWIPTRASASLAALGALAIGCGSSPGRPTPSPSPTASAVQPGGPVAGAYTLQITPSASCAMSRAPLSFPMTAAPAGTSPHPGVQVLLDPNGFRLELEALSETVRIRGGLGTNDEGTVSTQGPRVWMRVIAAAPVQQAANGQGEVVTGTLAGYVALAAIDGFEGSLGSCNATDHAFTLRTR